MKIRAQKGTFEESVQVIADIENNPEDVKAYLEWQGIVVDGPVDSVWYTPDPRINWKDTYLITVNGLAAAFCDEPLKGAEAA
jgi:hypothetical protein